MNRLNFDITYYNETTYDQIVTAEISKASGFSHILTNGGEISNKGIEIQLSGTPVQRTDLSWDVN